MTAKQTQRVNKIKAALDLLDNTQIDHDDLGCVELAIEHTRRPDIGRYETIVIDRQGKIVDRF